MEYIRVTKENIESEHICCAISNDNDCCHDNRAVNGNRFCNGKANNNRYNRADNGNHHARRTRHAVYSNSVNLCTPR